MIKFHRGGGGKGYLKNGLNLQLFAYKEVSNPYEINPFDKNYNTKADISEDIIVKFFTLSNPENSTYNGTDRFNDIKDDIVIKDEEGYILDPNLFNVSYVARLQPEDSVIDLDEIKDAGSYTIYITIESKQPNKYLIYNYESETAEETVTFAKSFKIKPSNLEAYSIGFSKIAGSEFEDYEKQYWQFDGLQGTEYPIVTDYLELPNRASVWFVIEYGTSLKFTVNDNPETGFKLSNYNITHSFGILTVNPYPMVDGDYVCFKLLHSEGNILPVDIRKVITNYDDDPATPTPGGGSGSEPPTEDFVGEEEIIFAKGTKLVNYDSEYFEAFSIIRIYTDEPEIIKVYNGTNTSGKLLNYSNNLKAYSLVMHTDHAITIDANANASDDLN